MIADTLPARLVFVDAAETAAGHCGWSMVAVHTDGTCIVTGNILGSTRDVGWQTALRETLRLTTAAREDASFDIVLAGACVIPVRFGEVQGREDLGPLGEAASFVEAARKLAESEAVRAGSR